LVGIWQSYGQDTVTPFPLTVTNGLVFLYYPLQKTSGNILVVDSMEFSACLKAV